METLETVSRKAMQVGRHVESSVGNFKNMMSSVSLMGDAKHFQEGRNKFDQIRTLLESKYEKEKLEAMKTLIAMMTLGRDVSAFFPHVVKNVVAESMEVKKLVYMYVIHYAAQNGDLALLCISSFQKDMVSPNPLVRAKSLQAMSSLRVPVVTHLIIIQLQTAIKDSSPYTRRTAAQVLPTVLKLDAKFRSDLIAMLTTLLTDDNVSVLSGALFAFEQICPNQWDLLHPNYRKICHLLADMDEWGQSITLQILLRYARTQFGSPFKNEEPDEDKEENKEDRQSDADNFLGKTKSNKKSDILDNNTDLDPDHRMLIACAKNLVYSMNTGVILAVATLLYYIAPKEECIDAIKALLNHMNTKREISYVVLANIATMTNDRPEIFVGFYKDFYVRSNEPEFIKELKLDILSKIATEANINNILREFTAYVRDPDVQFRCRTIDAMGRCASLIPEVADQTMKSLMQMVQIGCPEVVASSVIVIRQIIQRDPPKYSKTMISLLKLLEKTNVPAARCAIVWIIGEYRQFITEYVADALRILAKTFIHEADDVKMQILNLAVKVYILNSQQVSKLFKYILDLCKYDANYDLRDRARLIRAIFFQKKKKDENDETSSAINDEASTLLRTAMHEMFLTSKPVPEVISQFQDRDRFVMGTLSHLVIHSAGDNYEPLPDFPDIPPNNSQLRTPQDTKFNSISPDITSPGGENKQFSWEEDDQRVQEYTPSVGESSTGSKNSETTDDETDEQDDDEENDSEEQNDDEDENDNEDEDDNEDEEQPDQDNSDANEISDEEVTVVTKNKNKNKNNDNEAESSEGEIPINISKPSENDKNKKPLAIVNKSNEKKKIQESEEEVSSDEERKPNKATTNKPTSTQKSTNESNDFNLLDFFGLDTSQSTPQQNQTEIELQKESKSPHVFDPLTDFDKDNKTEIKNDKKNNKKKDNKKNEPIVNKKKNQNKKPKKDESSEDDNEDKDEDNDNDNDNDDEEEKEQSESEEEIKLPSKNKKSKKKTTIESDEESEASNKNKSKSKSSKSSVTKIDTTTTTTNNNNNSTPSTNTNKSNNLTSPLGVFDSLLDETMTSPTNNNNSNNLTFLPFSTNTNISKDNDMDHLSGASGELLNHAHTQGLQVNYEFIRSPSTFGSKFNLIKIKFDNKWNSDITNISVKPKYIDKNEQEYRDTNNASILSLAPNNKINITIHIKFGKTSEIRLDIFANNKKFETILKAPPGEMIKPNLIDYDQFKTKQSKMKGMHEKIFNTKYERIDEAAQKVVKIFNLAPLNQGKSSDMDLSKQRCFAGQILHDNSDVLLELVLSEKSNKIQCKVHCSEFMLIDSFADLANKVLNE